MKIAVFGQGYVGLTLSLAAAEAGHTVIGFDVNEANINSLLVGETHVSGIKKNIIKKFINSGQYLPTTNFSDVIGAEVLIIAVPTPLDNNRKPDLSFLLSAIKLIVDEFEGNALLINESTSYPGTLRNLIKPLMEKSHKAIFEFASAPERVDPGNIEWTLENTTRVICGLDKVATDKAISLYSTFCKKIYEASTVEVAEASKIFENTFRQINIALVNEFSNIASILGFSAHEAIKAASTKPFGFMPFYPSIGVGGHCIPVDPTYLSYISEEFGVKAKFIELANETNIAMPKKVANRIKNLLGGSLENKQIQIAGIAYKPGVSDMRESPALNFILELELLGAQVSWHDPLVKVFAGKKSISLDPLVHLGLIITPHDQIDFSIWQKAKTHVLDLSANSKNYGWPKFL
jgi:UDP-N-acetyl-D-glucosamine dehydrogenase